MSEGCDVMDLLVDLSLAQSQKCGSNLENLGDSTLRLRDVRGTSSCRSPSCSLAFRKCSSYLSIFSMSTKPDVLIGE